MTEYAAVTALFFQPQPFGLFPLHPPAPWHLRLSPEHSQSPLGIGRLSFPETDKLQSSLILTLQFLMHFKAPYSPAQAQ